MLNRLSTHFDFHGEALKLRSERQRVIASNIANADTPGYLAREIDFKSALTAATRGLPGVGQSPSPANAGLLATTAAGHFSVPTFSLSNAPGNAPTALLYRHPAQRSMDANSVDMDVERAHFADNSIRYEASLRFLNGQIKTMNLAVTGQ